MKEENFFYKDNILHYKISDEESLGFDLKSSLKINDDSKETYLKRS